MSAWGVYGIQGRDAMHRTVAANDKSSTKWFLRWRVDGAAHKRTFRSKGYARTFHDQLTRAQLMGWSADERGWPIEPTTPLDASTKEQNAVTLPTLDFATYCSDTWWPTMGPTFGDKNMLGHRNNMQIATALLVYRDGDSRCHTQPGTSPGDSLLLAHLCADDLRLAVSARSRINNRTKAANERLIAAALAADETDIEMPEERASPATVRAFYLTLSMIVKAARRSGHTTGDPLDGVAALARAPRTTVVDRIVPSLDEIFDLADTIATLGPLRNGRPAGDQYRSLILVAGTLAPRPGELVAHQPGWIDFDDTTVVRFAGTEAAVYDTATGLKGRRTRPLKHRQPGEERAVPSMPEVAEALRIHLELGYSSDFRTWTSPTGRGHLDWANIRADYWRPALARVFSGTVKEQLVTMQPKMLRKAAITLWYESGINSALAAEWAGHSPEVAQIYYAGRSAATYDREIALLVRQRNGGR